VSQRKWHKHINLGHCEVYERERQGAKQKRAQCDLHSFFGFGHGGVRDPVDKVVLVEKPQLVVRRHHVPPGRAAFVCMLVESNMSLNMLTKPCARFFFDSYALDAELLRDPRSLRNDILELGEWTQSEVFRMAAGRLVSVITDGTQWCGRTFYPVILYYIMPDGFARLELAGIFELDRAGHEELAACIGPLVKRLRESGASIIAEITDNAGNLTAAFSETGQKDTVQSVSGARMLWISCGIHTTQLVCATAEQEVDGFLEFLEWLRRLMAALRTKPVKRELREKGVSEKIPRPQEAKWTTIQKCATFVERNLAKILEIPRVASDAAESGRWSPIVAVLVPLGKFVEQAEGDMVGLQGLFLLHRELKATWTALAKDGNDYARQFKDILVKRFETTADGVLLQLSYFLTPAGHHEFQPLVECLTQQPAGLTAERVAVIREFAIQLPAMRERFLERAAYLFPSAPVDQVGSLFDEYARTLGFWRPGEQFVLGWGQRRWAYDAGSAQFVFAATSEILTQLPASEAAAERLFSVFEYLFNKQRMSAGTDLIHAEMMIRMLQLYHPEMSATMVSSYEPRVSE
jgi:hypothetical protein